MKLSFIGMSGAGKSYWAQKLSGTFHVIGIDDMIAKKLGLADVGSVASWMGWPDEPGYREREQRYLECEVSSMNEALDEIQASEENIILDTSGSVVYMSEAICDRMKSLTSVTYFEDTDEALLQRYLSNPKPLIWGDQFDQLPGESASHAVVRCYPRLIAYRKNLYERLAGK